MNKWFGLLGIIIILAAAFLVRFPSEREGSVLYTGLLTTEMVAEYPVMAHVVPEGNTTIGIALQDYELDFGVLPQGALARRGIDLEGSGNPVRVRLWAEGNISGMVGFSRDSLMLEGPESVEVRVSALEPGSYSGTIFLSSRVYNYRWLDWMNPVL